MRDTVDLAAGRLFDGSFDDTIPDRLLTRAEHSRVTTKLNDMVTSVCDYCHERVGNLLSAGASDKDKVHNEKGKTNSENSSSKSEEKEGQNMNDKSSWLSKRATTAQVCQLANLVEEFTETCEKLCGKQCMGLRSAFKVHFIKRIFSFLTSHN